MVRFLEVTDSDSRKVLINIFEIIRIQEEQYGIGCIIIMHGEKTKAEEYNSTEYLSAIKTQDSFHHVKIALEAAMIDIFTV